MRKNRSAIGYKLDVAYRSLLANVLFGVHPERTNQRLSRGCAEVTPPCLYEWLVNDSVSIFETARTAATIEIVSCNSGPN